jgi:hypothetical protein
MPVSPYAPPPGYIDVKTFAKLVNRDKDFIHKLTRINMIPTLSRGPKRRYIAQHYVAKFPQILESYKLSSNARYTGGTR